jgi:hypothetical protein
MNGLEDMLEINQEGLRWLWKKEEAGESADGTA